MIAIFGLPNKRTKPTSPNKNSLIGLRRKLIVSNKGYSNEDNHKL